MNPETKWFVTTLARMCAEEFGVYYSWVLIIDKENNRIEVKVIADGDTFPGYWWTVDLTTEVSRGAMRKALKMGIDHMKGELQNA